MDDHRTVERLRKVVARSPILPEAAAASMAAEPRIKVVAEPTTPRLPTLRAPLRSRTRGSPSE